MLTQNLSSIQLNTLTQGYLLFLHHHNPNNYMYLIFIGLTRTYRILFEEVNTKICKEVIVGDYLFLLICVLFQLGLLAHYMWLSCVNYFEKVVTTRN